MSDSSFSVRHEHSEPSQEPVAPTTVNSNSIIADYFRRDRLTHGWMRFDEYLNAILAYVMNTPDGSLEQCLKYDQHGFIDPDGRYLWYQRVYSDKGFVNLLDGLRHADGEGPEPPEHVTNAPDTKCQPWWASKFEEACRQGKFSDADVQLVVSSLRLYGIDAGPDVVTLDDLRKFLTPYTWQIDFHTLDELQEGNTEFLIDGVLPVGISAVGALSGSGKTWFALSMARALTTGKPFLGVFKVPEKVNVLYLVPEMQQRPFKNRAKRFGIGGAGFRCQTVSDGAAISLADERLKAAIAAMKPVVFLDTAIRFSSADDENSSSQNHNGLAKSIFALMHMGAKAVVFLHHATKASSLGGDMTLENVLRGSGDLGAMTDAVWALRYDRGGEKAADESDVGLGGGDSTYVKESRRLVRLQVACVKARDFQQPEGLRVQLEPFIDQIGDLGILADQTDQSTDQERGDLKRLEKAIQDDPTGSLRELGQVAGINKNRIKGLAEKLGFKHNGVLGWQRSDSGSDRPY